MVDVSIAVLVAIPVDMIGTKQRWGTCSVLKR